jgi:dienelactone hydrolase
MKIKSIPVRLWLSSFKPGKRAWCGAALGLLLLLVCVAAFLGSSLMNVAEPNWSELLGVLLNLSFSALFGFLVMLLLRLLRKSTPLLFVWALGTTFIFLFGSLAIMLGNQMIPTVLYFMAACAALGACAWVLARGGWKDLDRKQVGATLAGLIIALGMLTYGLVWLVNPGSVPAAPINAAADSSASIAPINLPNPSRPGGYAFSTLTYGSGSDLRRPEFGANASLFTTPVDATLLIDGWNGLFGNIRTAYWGFGPQALPLNGRVWYPDGSGPFPLVLIVHGNHAMEAQSDLGYAYLGELLASRGFIAVSVDENFLNIAPLSDYLGPIYTGLSGENDARAWLLLEHLRAWRSWNADPGSPFFGKVDMDNIALIGHSRGGNAVAAAAALNRLPFSPDNASLRFDFNFNLRAVIAIAPTEGSYYPGSRGVTVEDIDYLVLQGAQDGELPNFQGLQQYGRVAFSGTDYHFKSALLIYGANHGQFNTTWGRADLSVKIYAPFLNLAQLMPMQDQQQVARVYISAFLEASLHGATGYLPLFSDYRSGAAWLPDTIYLSRFADSTTQTLADYEEDIDLTTTTLPGGTIDSSGLSMWRERAIPFKPGWGYQDNFAAYLRWNVPGAIYSLSIPAGSLALTPGSHLTFSLADAQIASLPVDLTIEVVDGNGNSASLPLSSDSFLQPMLDVNVYKTSLMNSQPLAEPFLQTFELPLAAFQSENLAFDPANLAVVRFVFNLTPAGAVYLDDLGFRP